jgi:hypothetical protein
MTDLIKACGLWTRVSSTTGKKYLTGRLGGLRVLVFENARRGDDGEPDFVMHFGEAAPYKPGHFAGQCGRDLICIISCV